MPSGMDVKAYKKNPVVLLNHDRSRVIGKALSVTKKDDGIYVKAEIHKGACDDEVYYSIKNGLVQTFSIGFRCLAGEYKEVNKNNVFFITKSALLEVSCVTIPCNQESTFSVVKSLNGEGFYAENTDLDATTDGPTTKSADINTKEDGEETMKLALAELLSAAEVEKLKALGIDVAEEKEVSTKQYIDHTVAKQVEAAKESILAELRETMKGEGEGESETNTDGSEGAGEAGDEGAGESEGTGGEGEGELKDAASAEDKEEVTEETAKAVDGLADVLAKIKADLQIEDK